ncbi:hypothetical protein [Phaeobacter gallaeciensis]|uniref:hypothetical protein n=1 Tax=Phaeobacter gallaeciensis TaxID=60890 RepID=UPI00237F3C5A|nr:hypothetical protein [Phaeobacter gallaeciensis]MDE4189565.1 hypothetical protein [Phaeobacter gallaeciensis]MDE4198717.1 hypothetical protein [Phaeobacter gallaeciensis]MDE4202862.1 hypothetical protein [Phaeobacter gallaeciensis]MDE4207006.1 hypothetical protein [Phaeobacter gallaeciensis]MDE4215769.1 hypothetical protein [Phaeobacter gallaeciensis]
MPNALGSGRNAHRGIGHWNVTYQVASEELFQIWAKSTGTGLPDRQPGDPLPRMELDGTLVADLNEQGLATCVRIFWHSNASIPTAAKDRD